MLQEGQQAAGMAVGGRKISPRMEEQRSGGYVGVNRGGWGQSVFGTEGQHVQRP